jgi:hypothetical protein
LEGKRHNALGDQKIPITESDPNTRKPTLFLEDLRKWVSSDE